MLLAVWDDKSLLHSLDGAEEHQVLCLLRRYKVVNQRDPRLGRGRQSFDPVTIGLDRRASAFCPW